MKNRSAHATRNLADAFLERYPSSHIDDSMLATTRDALYGWTAERLVSRQTSVGAASFLYYFDHGYPTAEAMGLHAFHASELPYRVRHGRQHAVAVAARYPRRLSKPGSPTPCSATGPRSRATECQAPRVSHSGKPYGVERAYMAFEGVPRPETPPATRHVRARRASRLQTPRARSHSLALERRTRLSAAASRGCAVPVTHAY